MNLKKLMMAHEIFAYGMIKQTVDSVKTLKPEKFMGVYTHKPVPKAYIKFDSKNPLDLSKAEFILMLNGNEKLLRFKNCLEMRTIQGVRFEKWYRCKAYDRYVVRFKKGERYSKLIKKIDNTCSDYRNCTEIHEEIDHAFSVASARYYNIMKEERSFDGQEIL